MTGTSCGIPTSGSPSICCSRVTICGTPGSATLASGRMDARSFSTATASCATMFSIVVVPNAIAGMSASQCALERGDFLRRLVEHRVNIERLHLQPLQTLDQLIVGRVAFGGFATTREPRRERQDVRERDWSAQLPIHVFVS